MKTGYAGIWLLALAGSVCSGIAAAPSGVVEPRPAATASQTAPIQMNFRGAPLDEVLEYLSDAGGFIINKQAEAKGTIDAWSKDPVSTEEAVRLLNSALRKNGYGATRSGRILTIIELDNAKSADLDIVVGSDPEQVEKSEELVTQVIPVRYANASQLVNNLQVLLPTSASLTANESANTLILVSSRTDVKRMLKVVRAMDTALASVSSVRVFPLRHADATQLATVVQQLFAPTQSAGQRGAGQNTPGFTFGPGGPGGFAGGFPGGGFQGRDGGPGAGSGGGAQTRTSGGTGNAASARVVVVAEQTSNALVVSANADYMPMIAELIAQVDVPVADVVELRLFKLTNADPNELAEQLSQVFPDESRNGSQQAATRFGGGPFGGGPFGGGPFGGGPMAGGMQTGTSGASQRTLKQNKVAAVPDLRTSSLLVSAASSLMPQIEEMIQSLDSSTARKEVLRVFQFDNVNPQQLTQILQDLFNRNSTLGNNGSRISADQEDALTARQTRQQQQLSGAGTTGLGGMGSGNRGGAVGGSTAP